MHMRTKKWAKPELAVCPYFTDEAETKRGHWREQFEQDGPCLLYTSFAPGRITLNIKIGVDGEAQLNVQTRFDGTLLVRTNEGRQAIARSAERSDGFTVTGSGAFAAASAGVDGKISGVAFMDGNADGQMCIRDRSYR